MPRDVALAYAVNAKNSLQMWSGFSSYQLVFGQNPKLPDIFNAKLPQLENVTNSEIVAMHLNALHSARKAFIETENCNKIKLALKHKIRTRLEKYETGENVYYKREDSNRWKGPAMVIGQDKQLIFLRHGGAVIRVSVNRLMKVNQCADEDMDNMENQNDQSQTEATETDNNVDESNEDVSGDQDDSNEDDSGDHDGTVQNQNDASSNRSDVKVGDIIRCKMNDEWHKVEVVSRAGKQSGKYKNWFNVKEKDEMYSIDIDSMQAIEHVVESELNDIEENNEEEEVNIVLVDRKDHTLPEVIEAKCKELDIWKEMQVFEKVMDNGQDAISTNWIVTKKINDDVEKVKARLVCRGFEETEKVKGDSLTVNKCGIRIFLALASSRKWHVRARDVKSAFLQGKVIERDVYLIPPVEEREPNMLWKLNKVVYGLVDAAKNWYESVCDELIKHGCQKTILNDAFFFYNYDNKLEGMMILHVDDFLECGSDGYNKTISDKIKEKFIISKEEECSIKYVGLNILQRKDVLCLDQNHFEVTVEKPHIDIRTVGRERYLNRDEQKMYRSIVGQLNWLSQMSRPDLCFEVMELSMMFKHPCVYDYHRALKAVSLFKSRNVSIKFPQLVIDHDLKIVTFSDAAFANLVDLVSSGSGYIVFLVDRNRRCCPLAWSANKVQRVVHSTLAAETLTLGNALGEAQYQQALIKNILGESYALPIRSYVDNKSLKEALYSVRLVDDRRLRIDIAALKESLKRKEFEGVFGCQEAKCWLIV